MSEDKINKYNNGKIYTIRCRDNNNLIYVGSTVQPLYKRWNQHKRTFKNENHKEYNKLLYIKMRELGIENFYIELYKNINCKNIEELLKHEGEIIREIGILNKNIAGRTHEESQHYYNDKNKEQIKQQKKQYYENNKDKINEQRKQYNAHNKEQIKQQKKQYRNENQEQIKQYYINNKEQIKEQRKQYTNENKEIIIQRRRKIYNENKETINARRRELYKLKKQQQEEEQQQPTGPTI
jgi:hypothetical protein